jgi:hypothetical protein
MNDEPQKLTLNEEEGDTSARQNISPKDFDTGSISSDIDLNENILNSFRDKVFYI